MPESWGAFEVTAMKGFQREHAIVREMAGFPKSVCEIGELEACGSMQPRDVAGFPKNICWIGELGACGRGV